MIILASLVFAQAVAGLPGAPAETALTVPRIDVVASLLPTVQASVAQTSEGGWRCLLSGSTGSAYVDDRVCQATAICSIRQATGRREFGDCMQSARRGILDDYSDLLKR